MFELTWFLYAMGAVSLVLVPVLLFYGLPVIGPYQWLFVVTGFILVKRRYKARHISDTPRYRVTNAALLWLMLYLGLSIAYYYWRNPPA